MTNKGNYHEFKALPVWTRPQWHDAPDGDRIVVNGDHPYKWSGDKDPPAIGDRVRCYMNKLGTGTVLGYFAEHGWLGVLVALDKSPAWRRKQLPDNPPAHVFGLELQPRLQRS